jgi:hypothetical protein
LAGISTQKAGIFSREAGDEAEIHSSNESRNLFLIRFLGLSQWQD